MKQKDILCDAGSFISLTSTCLDNVVYFFAEKYGVRFVIPASVEEEAVGYPLKKNLKKYLFSAIRIHDMLNDGIVVKTEVEVKDSTRRIMEAANNLFFVRGRPMRIIHRGEAEMLATAKELDVKHILIDERTTRMLLEAPFRIKEHFEKEFHTHVMINKKNLVALSNELNGINAMRSSELLILGYEKGFFNRFQEMEKQALKAALYKVKYSGCSITFKEIDEYLRWKS